LQSIDIIIFNIVAGILKGNNQEQLESILRLIYEADLI